MTKLNRGFTLIELLVVIAIIGILSTIVLASLGTARTKGEDSAIQANLSNMRAQAELLYSNLNSYGPAPAATGCASATSTTATSDIFGTTSAGTLKNLAEGVLIRATGNPAYCNSGTSGWVMAVKLKGAGHACADGTGASKTYAGTSAVSGAAGTGAASTTALVCN